MGGKDLVHATPVSQRADSRRVPLTGPHAFPLLALVAVLVLASLPVPGRASASAEGLVLRVGQPGDMWTLNLLPPIANDVWTTNVLYRVYGSPLLRDPDGAVRAYIAKGVDFNENGKFSPSTEYNVWAERAGAASPLQVTVYYDFNGARWHDGTDMTVWDLFFSYHLNAMNPRFNTGLRVLSCDPDFTTTYEACERQLGIRIVGKNWEGESNLPGDPNQRVAVQYMLNQPFALFYTSTLYPVMLPMREWSRTGGGRHVDFGCAVWIPNPEAARQGIPECGTANSAMHGQGVRPTDAVPGSKPYDYLSAERWQMTNADVIGNGPFKELVWTPGQGAKVVRNEDWYTGVDESKGVTYDPQLARVVQVPAITGIRFTIVRPAMGVFALRHGDIDFYTWPFSTDAAWDLYAVPEIGVEAHVLYGYTYLAYNMRREPFGYRNDDPDQDVGHLIRVAVSHLVDKESIVQNFVGGVVADGFVSPAFSFWYDDTLPHPAHDPATARAILDSPAARAAGIGPDPPGSCSEETPQGCRNLPRIGTASFGIYSLRTDLHRWHAGEMIAAALRDEGLNAQLEELPLSYSWSSFDLLLLSWRISPANDPAEFLFDFFHTSWRGQNYPGFSNATFDRCIEDTVAETDRSVRRGLLSRCQHILANARPAEPLYFPTILEAYRRDRFVNWTLAGDTIWNDWSLFRIHPPIAPVLTLRIDVPSTIPSGAEEPLRIAVRDRASYAVAGAPVTVTVSAAGGGDAGILLAGGGSGPSVVVVTDLDGRANVTYRAPRIQVATFPVKVEAIVASSDYLQEAATERTMTIVRPDVPALHVRLEVPAGDRATPNVPHPLVVYVTDSSGGAIPDATVNLRILPAGDLSRRDGSSVEMKTVTASFPTTGTYVVEADASKPGYLPASAVATVRALDSEAPGPPPPPAGPDPAAAVLLAMSVAIAATAGTAALALRRSPRVRRRVA